MVFWLVWFLIGIVFIVLYAVLLLPRLLLKARAAGFPVCGKAIKRIKDDRTEKVIYEPSLSARPYFKSYSVTKTREGIFFRGEWAKNCAFVKYEITVFNARNEVIEVVTVKEKFNSDSVTTEVRLPEKTDIISLRVLCVDDMPLPGERLGVNASYLTWTGIACLSFAAIVDVLIWMIITFTLGCLNGFTPSLSLPVESWGILFGITTPTVFVLMALFTFARHLLLNERRKKG